MKSMLLQIGYRILHYLYINRNTIFSIAKRMKEDPNIKFDGNIELKEVRAMLLAIKDSGLKIDSKDIEIPVWADFTQELTEMPENKYQNLVEYKQIWPTCAIYSVGRTIMFNTGLEFTQAEHELVAQRARDLGYLSSTGMTFINAGKVWTQYLKELGYTLKQYRVPYGSDIYNELTGKDYMAQIGGYITKEFLLDTMDDGVIDISNYTWNEKKQYGHAWSSLEMAQFDNYAGRKYNIYENRYFQTFISKGYAFYWSYIYVIEGQKQSDYDKFLDRGYIEQPQPNAIPTERRIFTIIERILTDKGL
jgi:hypothetical protein